MYCSYFQRYQVALGVGLSAGLEGTALGFYGIISYWKNGPLPNGTSLRILEVAQVPIDSLRNSLFLIWRLFGCFNIKIA